MATPPSCDISFHAATAGNAGEINRLAQSIWWSCYPGMLSDAQIAYMLELMYAPATIARQIDRDGVHYALVRAGEGGTPQVSIGYLAYRSSPCGRLALDKCYLEQAFHSRGIGQRMLDHVDAVASRRGHAVIELGVNRRNERALRAYTRHGYLIEAEVATPIGMGFVMDDYKLIRQVPPCPCPCP